MSGAAGEADGARVPRSRALAVPRHDDAFVWALVNAAPDGIAVIDDGGRIVLASRRAEELFGYDRGQLLGEQIEILIPEGSREAHQQHRRSYRLAPRTRRMGAGSTLQGLHRDGTEFSVEISLSPLVDDSSRMVIVAVRAVEPPGIGSAAGGYECITRERSELVLRRLSEVSVTLQEIRNGDGNVLGVRYEQLVGELDALVNELRDAIDRQHPRS